MNIDKIFIEKVKQIVYKILEKEGLLKTPFRLGVIDTVVSTKQVKAFIDGSTQSQILPCNPDVTFAPGDDVYIIQNGLVDKFVLCKRGV